MSLKHEIIGGQLQAIRFELQPGQTLIGEALVHNTLPCKSGLLWSRAYHTFWQGSFDILQAGCMLFIDDGITFESRLGDGSIMQQMQNQGFFGGMMQGAMNMAKRVISNETLFNTWFTNSTGVPRAMAVAAPMMGTMFHIKLHDLPQSTILAQSGAFVCSAPGVRFTIALVKKFGAGFFGGEGFILQKLQAEAGTTGELWLHGGGTIIRKELNNEELTLEPGCLMAFTDGIDYDIGFPGFGNAMLSGNVFMAKLRGTGSVWIQSTPSSKIIDLIIAQIPQESKSD